MKPNVIVQKTALSTVEQRRLEACEDDIQRGGDLIVNALKIIHDEKLYREEFGTFDEYLGERLGKSRQWASLQFARIEVIANIAEQAPKMSTIVDKMTEGATRELNQLEPPQQAAAVQIASNNGEKVPTAKETKAAVQQVTQPTREYNDSFDVDVIEEQPSPAIVTDQLKRVVPAKFREAHQARHQINAAMKQLDQVRQTAAEISQQPGGEHIDSSLFDDEWRKLKDVLQCARYYTHCNCDGGKSCKLCKGVGWVPESRKSQVQES